MTRQGTMARSWSRAALLAAAALTCWSCWCFKSARADVYVLVSAYDLEPLPDLEADFGPSVPSMGIEGVLRLADPHDACQPFTFTDFDTPWIALISRQQQVQSMNCTFDIKVMHAQMAGAAAAIVYDYFYESLITMSMPKGHTEPSIPSVFVTDRSGFILTKLLEVEGQDLRVRIMPVTTVAWLEALVSTLLGLMSITMVIASFYAMRSWGLWLSGNQNLAGGAAAAGPGFPPGRNAGLPPSAIRALPVIIYEAPSSRSASRTCSWKPSDKAKGAGEGGPSAASALEEGLLPSPNQSSNSSEHDWPHQTGRHAGETKRVCAICLEDYTSGEKVRVLPCLHRFHKTCVDQWFGSRRMCPVCKHDAGTPLAPPPADGEHAGRLGFTARLARLGAGLLSFMGLGSPASADPAAEVLLSRSNPTSPNHEPARQPATNRRHSRLWDLYLAYAALDAEASQEGGVAGSAAAGAAGEGAEEDVEAGLAEEGPVAYEPPPLLPEETAVPALRSVREGPSHPIPIQPAAEAGRGEGAAAGVGPAAEGGAAAAVQVPESLPFPATPPMQAPATPPTRVD